MPAFDENWVRKRNPNRFSCRCRILDGRIPSLDRSHTGTFVIGRKDNVITYSESSRLYSAGYNPALVKSIDVLDSKPEGTVRPPRAGGGRGGGGAHARGSRTTNCH